MGFAFRKQKKPSKAGATEQSSVPTAISIDTSSPDKTKRKFSLRSARNKSLDGTPRTTTMTTTGEKTLLPKQSSQQQLEQESDFVSDDGNNAHGPVHAGAVTPESSASYSQYNNRSTSGVLLPDLTIVPTRDRVDGEECMEMLLGDMTDFPTGEESAEPKKEEMEGVDEDMKMLLGDIGKIPRVEKSAKAKSEEKDVAEFATSLQPRLAMTSYGTPGGRTTEDPITVDKGAVVRTVAVVTPEPSPTNGSSETPNKVPTTTTEVYTVLTPPPSPTRSQQLNHGEQQETTPPPITPMSASSTNSQTPFDQKAKQKREIVGRDEDPTIRKGREQQSESGKSTSNVTKKLLDAFGSCQMDSATELVQEVSKRLLVPTSTMIQAKLGVIIPCGVFVDDHSTDLVQSPKTPQCYDDHFAVKFLNVRFPHRSPF
jgi:hypothetical protein